METFDGKLRKTQNTSFIAQKIVFFHRKTYCDICEAKNNRRISRIENRNHGGKKIFQDFICVSKY